MKTIKIFLASSEELKDERVKFGNLIRQLDDIFLKRSIHLKLLVWEDMDPCYNNCRKQDEYNAWIRESQIFVALFHTKVGRYTMEEVEIARNENSRRQEPKLMICCRTLQNGEVETDDLIAFKQELEKKLGHFWSNYATTDKLHLDFVMYFMRLAEGRNDALKVENGQIVVDGFTVASMDNLPFAACDEGYQGIKKRLESLAVEVKLLKNATQQAPSVEFLKTLHQQKCNEYNALKEKFEGHQQALFDTARRISGMQLEEVSSELRRAVDAFEQGHVEAANAILDGIERETERHVEQMDRNRHLVHQDIEALLLKSKTLMVDVSKSIEERIAEVESTYKKADGWAEKSLLPKKKYALLLADYGKYLTDYAKYAQALKKLHRACCINKELYGFEHPDTAASYNNIGFVNYKRGDYDQALMYYFKALAIREKMLGLEHPDTATSNHSIGVVYDEQGDYAQALEYYSKALKIRENVLGFEHPDTARTYNNIGVVYKNQGEYDQALEYYFKALEIRENVLNFEHPDTAASYNNIGVVLHEQGDYDLALEYYFKALAIYVNVLGFEHPDTAASYNNIGGVYYHRGDYDLALEYYFKALAIREKVLGSEHPSTATSYNNIGAVYCYKGSYDQALEYYFKALAIREKVLGSEHPNTTTVKENIEVVQERRAKIKDECGGF